MARNWPIVSFDDVIQKKQNLPQSGRHGQ